MTRESGRMGRKGGGFRGGLGEVVLCGVNVCEVREMGVGAEY